MIAASCIAAFLLVAASGCTTSSSQPAPTGHNMAGANIPVHIPASVIAARPKPWDLSTPQSAVRSYLDWTDYAYRIATSDVASPTMSGDEFSRVDAYVQYNLESAKLIDQHLNSITMGKPTVGATSTLVPTAEQWTYSYLSVSTGNRTLSGPFNVSYDSTYTVVKDGNGHWTVASLKATKTGGTLK